MKTKFPETRPARPWSQISPREWNDWVWQQKKRVKTATDLGNLLTLTTEEREAIEQNQERFRMAITPYYASLIDPNDPLCPIRQQAVPQSAELQAHEDELEDPLAEEKHLVAPALTHRYPDRALLYVTHNCPVYCRHCTRKRKVSDPRSATLDSELELAFEYLRHHPEVRDVLVSGGDPLSLSDGKLEWVLSELRSIPSVEIIRLATRNPVTLPQRITPELVEILKKYQPIYVMTHFNHPRECTAEAFRATALLADGGLVLSNQMVLLRGINDSASVIAELNRLLLQMRIRPYYILQCDLAQGLRHFRTPIEQGVRIMDELRGWNSGLAIPTFVVDLPGGGGKISLGPEYQLERDGPNYVFRNYRGEIFHYADPPTAGPQESASSGAGRIAGDSLLESPHA